MCRPSNLQAIAEEVSQVDLGTLTVHPETIFREDGYRKIKGTCSMCGKTYVLSVDNIRSKKTTNCLCMRGRKYTEPQAKMLGERYQAMVQRCHSDTHCSDEHYRGRGIKVLFESREHFIRWALDTWPDTDFKGLDLDRIDNNGHYSPDNLRLVTRSENLKNRRRCRKPRGKDNKNSKQVVIEGTLFDCMGDAAEYYGVCRAVITVWANTGKRGAYRPSDKGED